MKHVTTEKLKVAYVASTLLRKPNKAVVEDYARLMAEGVEFPALVLGTYPEPEKEENTTVIIDGAHRYLAGVTLANAKKAEVSLPVTLKNYKNKAEAFADMLALNNARGLQVDPKDRDARIILLAKEGMKQKEICKRFGLTQASVSRIVAGKQKAGKEKAPRQSEGPGQTPYKPQAMLKALGRIAFTLEHKRAVNSILDYVSPEEGKLNKQYLKIIEAVADKLALLHKAVTDYDKQHPTK